MGHTLGYKKKEKRWQVTETLDTGKISHYDLQNFKWFF